MNIIATIFFSLTVAHFINIGLIHLAIFIIIFLAFFLIYLKTDSYFRIFFLVFSLGFPFPIYLAGRDIGVSSTMLIMLFGLFYFLTKGFNNKFSSFKNTSAVYLLIVIGVFSGFRGIGILTTAIRYNLIFVSGFILFLVIIGSVRGYTEKFIEYILNSLLIVVLVQIILGFAISVSPFLGKILSFFKPVYAGGITFISTDAIKRFNSLIIGPESAGEILAVLSPFVIYLYFKQRRIRYGLLFLIFLFAELATATRSTIILFALGTCITLFFYSKRINLSKVIVPFASVVLFLTLTAVIFNRSLFGFLTRFALVSHSFESGNGVSAILNRRDVWALALQNLRQPTLFGHGFLLPQSFVVRGVNFHSLYFTMIYQIGIVGSAIFFIFLGKIYFKLGSSFKLASDNGMKTLLFCSLLSISIFLINEIKYEYNRNAPYYQLCWAIFALYFIIANYRDLKEAYV